MPTEEAYDFFVSYRGVDRELASWVARTLEGHGWSVVIQERDFTGWSFVEDMERAFRHSRAMAAVLTRSYLTSGFTQHEYDTARFLAKQEGRYRVVVLAFSDWEGAVQTDGAEVIDLRSCAEDREECGRRLAEELRRAGFSSGRQETP